MAKGFDALPKRFYKTVDVAAVEGGFAVQLDGRVPKSPRKSPLVLPTGALAGLIAGEWDAQDQVINLNEMAATRRAFTAIDQIPPARGAVADEIASYAGSDVLCYFAHAPRGLVARQTAQWVPLLDWAQAELGLTLERTEGVVHRSQPPQTLARVRELALTADDMALTALAEATALFGSAVLAFAVQRRRLDAHTALDLSRLDEIFQIEQWGVDDEAAVRIEGHRREAAGLQAWFEAL
jgi:chaperone required for assembly of F1-ATPase